MWCFGGSFVASLKKLLNKQSRCRWFVTPRRSCVVTVMPIKNCTLHINVSFQKYAHCSPLSRFDVVMNRSILLISMPHDYWYWANRTNVPKPLTKQFWNLLVNLSSECSQSRTRNQSTTEQNKAQRIFDDIDYVNGMFSYLTAPWKLL